MGQITNVFNQVLSILMTILMSMGIITSPPADTPLKKQNENAVLNFVVVGDPQVANYNPTREAAFVSFAEDVMNSQTKLDAFILAGDIAENGFQSEFDQVYKYIKDFNTDNFIMATGNHDIRLRDYSQSSERFLTFMNSLNSSANAQTSTHYKYEVNGYTFLVMGSDRTEFEEAYISPAQLQWLNTELNKATKSGKPVFVICHQPLAESHGLPDTWGSSENEPVGLYMDEYKRQASYDLTGSVGEQTNDIYDIITRYKNVFFITGHLHTGFGKYTYQTIDGENNVQGINVPSVGIDNKDGVYNNTSTGLYCEVTEDQVIFYARDFAEAKFLSADEFGRAVQVFDIID